MFTVNAVFSRLLNINIKSLRYDVRKRKRDNVMKTAKSENLIILKNVYANRINK